MLYLTTEQLQRLGKYSFCCTAIFFVLAVVVPMIILKTILAHLQSEYQFSEQTKDKWQNIPGGKAITYRKTIKLFDILPQKSFILDTFDLNTSFKAVFNKNARYDDPKFVNDHLLANYVQEYTLDTGIDASKFSGTSIRQIRPGVLRAIEAIESRSPGYSPLT